MKSWSWNTPTYWTDIETIQKITTRNKRKGHEGTDFNYNFIIDKPRRSAVAKEESLIDELMQELMISAILKGIGAGLVTVGTWLAAPDPVAGPVDEIVGIGLIWIGRGFLFIA